MHLFAKLIDHGLEREADMGELNVGGFSAQRVGFAVELLGEEVKLTPRGLVSFDERACFLAMRREAVKLLAQIGTRGDRLDRTLDDLRPPRAWPLRTICSRTRVEKKRSRDSSNRMLVRSSISMRISLNSCSLKLTWPPCRSLIALDSIHHVLPPPRKMVNGRRQPA